MGYKVYQGSLTSSSSMLGWFYKMLMVSSYYCPCFRTISIN